MREGVNQLAARRIPELGAAINGGDGSAKLWDAVSGELIHTLSHEDTVWSAEWNGDESLILTRSGSINGRDGSAKLWDASSGELIHTLSHDSRVWSAEWNADESLILTSSGSINGGDGSAKLWDASSGELIHTLSHEDTVWSAEWNGNESLILTRSSDGTAKLWNAASGTLIFTMEGDSSSVTSAQWNQAETQIMISAENGNVFRYHTHAKDRRELACQRVTLRNFTFSEWQLFNSGQPYRKTCPHLPVHCSVPENEWPAEHIDEMALCTPSES